jgi:hypothetical protein
MELLQASGEVVVRGLSVAQPASASGAREMIKGEERIHPPCKRIVVRLFFTTEKNGECFLGGTSPEKETYCAGGSDWLIQIRVWMDKASSRAQ